MRGRDFSVLFMSLISRTLKLPCTESYRTDEDDSLGSNPSSFILSFNVSAEFAMCGMVPTQK